MDQVPREQYMQEQHDEGASFVCGEPNPAWSAAWNSWLDQRLTAERKFIFEVVGQALGQAILDHRKIDKADVARRLKKVWSEIARLRSNQSRPTK
jgi:hypothetical protein